MPLFGQKQYIEVFDENGQIWNMLQRKHSEILTSIAISSKVGANMSNYLVKNILRLRERGFLQITKKTVVSLFPFFLFPFFLFSAIIGVISQSVFSEPGYINQFFRSRIGFLPFASFLKFVKLIQFFRWFSWLFGQLLCWEVHLSESSRKLHRDRGHWGRWPAFGFTNQ